ncbi:MAG: saccharopine dehydrogenase, partial [Pseudomonadota bacterium]
RVVHKSNALQNHAYGEDFRYDEAVLTGSGLSGRLKSWTASGGMGLFAVGSTIGPIQSLMKKTLLPKPGEGPNADQREAGFFNIIIEGETADGQTLRARVKGDRDPGYGSTSKMLGETALLLAESFGQGDANGGMLTPATALGQSLIDGLSAHAGLSFKLER